MLLCSVNVSVNHAKHFQFQPVLKDKSMFDHHEEYVKIPLNKLPFMIPLVIPILYSHEAHLCPRLFSYLKYLYLTCRVPPYPELCTE